MQVLKNIEFPGNELSCYTINLNKPMEKRYQEIINSIDLKIDLKMVKSIIENIYNDVSSLFSNISIPFVLMFQKKFLYYSELKYWSEVLDISLYKLYIFQYIIDYFITSSCIVSSFEDQKSLIRTFEFKYDIKKLMYRGIYVKDGKKIYETIQIIGGVGFNHVKNLYHQYEIFLSSRNTSQSSSNLSNIYNFIKGNWLGSYLIRELTEKFVNFDQACESLCKFPLIFPSYFVTFSYKGLKSCIIQRDINNFTIYKDDTIILSDCDQGTLQPNINFSSSRFEMISGIKRNKVENFVNKFCSFPILRGSTIYILISNKDEMRLNIL